MPAESPLKLVMKFHRRSERFIIESEGQRTIQFPQEEKICEIWRQTFPGVHFFIGSGIRMPTTYFYADVGPGTKAKDRKKFCDALALECEINKEK